MMSAVLWLQAIGRQEDTCVLNRAVDFVTVFCRRETANCTVIKTLSPHFHETADASHLVKSLIIGARAISLHWCRKCLVMRALNVEKGVDASC